MIKLLKVFIFLLAIHKLSAGDIITVMNNEFYTNGETVKGVIQFNKLNAEDKSIKYALIDILSKKQILSGFTKVKNNNASYEFDLDYKLTSGSYQVDFSVLDKAYMETIIGSVRFLLINPSDENEIKEYKTINKFYTTAIKEVNFISAVKNGDNVAVTSQNPGAIFSLSQRPFNQLNLDVNSKIEQQQVDNWQSNIFINGTLVRGEQPTSQSILGLYSIESDKFFMTKTLTNGSFIFLLDDYEGSNNFQLFPYAEKYNQLTFKTNNPINGNDYKETVLPLDKLKKVLDDFKNRSAINQYFGVVTPIKAPLQNARIEQQIKAFKKYIPANYKVFTYFHQFCKENSLPLQFLEINSKYKASCLINSTFSKKFNSSSENPLIILNGVATRNYDAIARIPTAEIETIEFYMDFEKQRKFYNVYGTDPIVKIKTKTNDNLLSKHEKSNFITVNGYTQESKNENHFIVYNKAKNLSPILEPKIYFGKLAATTTISLPNIKGEVEFLSLQINNGEWIIQKQFLNI